MSGDNILIDHVRKSPSIRRPFRVHLGLRDHQSGLEIIDDQNELAVAIFGLQKQQGNEDDGKVGVCVNGIAEER